MALRVRTLASALAIAFAAVLLASACGQRPEGEPFESPPFETQDDDDPYGDPDVGVSIGSGPEVGSTVGDNPAYWWGPPSGTPSEEEVGESEPEPNASTNEGDAPAWGVIPGSPVPSPRGQPAESCEETCDRDFEGDSGRCIQRATEEQRRECQRDALAKRKRCQEGCQKKSDKDCDEKHYNCTQYGPKSCLKKWNGQSVCYRCWERCNAGDDPSPKCKKCLF